jgi:hypothetical protein
MLGNVSSWGSVMGGHGDGDGGVQLQVRVRFERVGNDGKQKHPVPDFHSRLAWAQWLLDWIWLLGLHGLPACNAGSICLRFAYDLPTICPVRAASSAPTCMDAKNQGMTGPVQIGQGGAALGACQTGKADGTGSQTKEQQFVTCFATTQAGITRPRILWTSPLRSLPPRGFCHREGDWRVPWWESFGRKTKRP